MAYLHAREDHGGGLSWGFGASGVGVKSRYCRRIQAGWAKAAKPVTRVRARGTPSSHRTTREAFIAAAVQTCCSPVLARPTYRLRRRPKARTACESVPSIPARTW